MVIIGLAGPAGCGKDTVADILVRNHGYTRIAFADPLRAMALALDPIIYEDETGIVRLSELVGEGGWDWAKREFTEVRRTLQRLGTEVVREHVGPNFWVERAFAGMKKNGTRKYVLTDCRFSQEFQAVVEAGGIMVEICRPGLKPLPGNHASESGLVGLEPDLFLQNDQDLEHLWVIAESLTHWKRCRKCNEVKSSEEYMKNSRLAQGLHSYCRPCEASRTRDWRAKDPIGAARKERERHLLSTYGITLDRFDEILEEQGGGCGICLTEPTPKDRAFAVDHNHETGATRGILCSVCNAALGRVEVIPGWCASALAYLSRWSS